MTLWLKERGVFMLKAGTSRVCITPGADPGEVKSYRNPAPPGVYQDVFAKALAFEDEKGERLVIVSIDIIEVDGNMLEQIREGIKRKVGLEEHQVLLCVSHTHSGPMREGPLEPFGLTVPEYRELLIDRVVCVVGDALTEMEPVKLYFGSGTLPVWRGNPYGEVDPEVGILRAEDRDGKVKAVVMSYACHASAMGTGLIGNDYPGFAQEIIENRYDGSVALFAQGCSGEIKPYNIDPNAKFMYRIPPAVVAGLGWELAKEVTRVIEETPMEEVVGDLHVDRRIIELPMEGPPTEEEVKRIKSVHQDVADGWGEVMLKQIKEGKIDGLSTVRPYEIEVIGIGERFRLVALQGEPCVRIGLRIKEQLTPNAAKVSAEAQNIRSVLVFGYTNGDVGYIPSLDVLTAGGYEAESYLFYKWAGPYKPEIEDLIVKTVLELG
jgi:hypothetical protein